MCTVIEQALARWNLSNSPYMGSLVPRPRPHTEPGNEAAIQGIRFQQPWYLWVEVCTSLMVGYSTLTLLLPIPFPLCHHHLGCCINLCLKLSLQVVAMETAWHSYAHHKVYYWSMLHSSHNPLIKVTHPTQCHELISHMSVSNSLGSNFLLVSPGNRISYSFVSPIRWHQYSWKMWL